MLNEYKKYCVGSYLSQHLERKKVPLSTTTSRIHIFSLNQRRMYLFYTSNFIFKIIVEYHFIIRLSKIEVKQRLLDLYR